ncbi:MAG TPA: hypothetical protein VJO33_15750 [Gemmatimonadaceae bacterium]|nr:hypothetical protein [Gemmatimonadaceae bacterium]
MRALLGVSGTTDVEVTTGSFDGAAAALGHLASVQVKSLANGASFTSNQTSLTSNSASFPYTGVAHGTPVNVQAIVRDVDGPRSDVVNVADVVHFRPDLFAEIQGPAGAPIGGAINFFAVVSERLGELGARASCVAYVDGTEVDRANNIWIDAGSSVGCMFTVTFATTGTHKVEVRIENVQPGDFDDSNNIASTTIRVQEPNGYAAYSLQAHDYTINDSFRFVTLFDGILSDQRQTQTGREQFASFVGLIPQALAFPIRLHGEIATNGATIDVTDDTFDSAPFVDWQPGYCDSHFPTSNSDTFVCVYTGGYLAGQTVVQYDWSGQEIRYHSDTYSKVWGDDTSEPSYQASDFAVTTPLVTFGPDLTGELAIYSGGSATPVASAANRISLAPDVQRLDVVHPSCTPDLFPPVTCFESHFLLTGNFGYTDFGSWPVFTP